MYINFVSKSVHRPSVCSSVRPFIYAFVHMLVNCIVNIFSTKLLDVTTVNVLKLFLTVPWVGLQCVSVVFPDHTHF